LWDELTHGIYAKEDRGWTSSLNPFSTWRHFRLLQAVQPELDAAIAREDRPAFESLMHQGQDSFNPAHQKNPVYHVWASLTGQNPDSPSTYPQEYEAMKAWTVAQEAKSNAYWNPASATQNYSSK